MTVLQWQVCRPHIRTKCRQQQTPTMLLRTSSTLTFRDFVPRLELLTFLGIFGKVWNCVKWIISVYFANQVNTYNGVPILCCTTTVCNFVRLVLLSWQLMNLCWPCFWPDLGVFSYKIEIFGTVLGIFIVAFVRALRKRYHTVQL